MAKYLLAHDIGTSGDKAVLFREDGKLVHSIIGKYPTFYEDRGAVEQNPDDWWRAVCETTRQMVALVDKRDIAAISFGGQMMGSLCVDEKGRPLRNAIIWADTRSVEQAAYIEAHYGRDRFYETTGHRLSPSHSITKLMWIRDHEPDVYRNTHRSLNAKDYIVYKLTGVMATDNSDASGTLAYDINKKCWAEDVIEAAGLELDKFPQICNGLAVIGHVTKEAADATGLKQGMPVVLGGGDGGMTRIGSGCCEPPAYCVNLGTSAVTAAVDSVPARDPLQRIVTWNSVDARYVGISGTMQACGASIAWMKNNLCYEEVARAKRTGESHYKYIDENAAKSPVGARGLLFLPYLHGERAPHWNAHAKGAFVGLTMKHDANDMKRAVMEGVCLNMGLIHRVVVQNMRSKLPDQIIVSGGAAKSPVVLQALADIYNAKMAVTDIAEEAGSLGAAIVAGYGVGLYPTLNMAERFFRIVQVAEPVKENVEQYSETIQLFEEAYRCMIDLYPRLGN